MNSEDMIDTHAHLTDGSFTEDLPQVLQRARQAGVSQVICMSCNPAEAEKALHLHHTHTGQVKPAVGLHPETATALTDEQLSTALADVSMFTQINRAHLAAIGEVGLDETPHLLQNLQCTDAAKQRQKRAFSTMIGLARAQNLPLSVHSRNAGHKTLTHIIDASKEGPLPPICMHAFDGRAIYAERAMQALPHTLYFSIPPSLARSTQFTKLVKRLPITALLLESDSPALAAKQGVRNEPAAIAGTVHLIAMLKNLRVADVQTTMLSNTYNCFRTLRP